MADVFDLAGAWGVTPLPSGQEPGSSDPALSALLLEKLYLSAKEVSTYSLTTDLAQSVAFGGLTSAHVLIAKTSGGKAKIRITSSDGSLQAIPVDSLLILTCPRNTPITAIDLTRVSGISTSVRIFIGQLA